MLHLSGGTHLAWSAAFSLLFPVTAWHPQPAYTSTFLFPFFRLSLFPGTARRCFVSVRLHPSALSVSFFFRPTSSSTTPICSPRSRLRASRPNQTHKQIVGEKKKKKKEYKSKRVRCPPGEGGMRAEVIYLPLVWSLMECLPSSCCGVSPSFPSLHSSVPIFISLTVAFSSWVQRPGKRAHVSKRKVIPSWKRRMTV